jgi:hypothetical protein
MNRVPSTPTTRDAASGQAEHRISYIEYVIRSIGIFLLCSICWTASAQRTITSVDFFAASLQMAPRVPVKLNEVWDSSRFVLTCSHPNFLKAMNAFETKLATSKLDKSTELGDYNVFVVLNYSDGTKGYMAGNKSKDLESGSKVYKKRTYEFYNLINRYVRLKTVETFLKDRKILAPFDEKSRVCK